MALCCFSKVLFLGTAVYDGRVSVCDSDGEYELLPSKVMESATEMVSLSPDGAHRGEGAVHFKKNTPLNMSSPALARCG